MNAFYQQSFLDRLKKSFSELEGSADALVWRKGGVQTATAGTSATLGPFAVQSIWSGEIKSLMVGLRDYV